MSENSKHIQEELAAIAPKLSKVIKQEKEAPAFYFEAMQQRVLSQIKTEENTVTIFEKWLQNMLHIFQPKYALPAFTIALLFAVAHVLHIAEKDTTALASNELIADYLMNEELSIEAFSETLNSNEIALFEKSFASINIEATSISDYILEDTDDDFFATDFM